MQNVIKLTTITAMMMMMKYFFFHSFRIDYLLNFSIIIHIETEKLTELEDEWKM